MSATSLRNTVLFNNENLKALYEFESGALTTDSSGNSHTLTAVSDPAETTGVYGGGVDFDGDDCYSIVDHADLKPTTFSVGMWFKTSASGVTDGLYQSNRYDGGANVFGFLLFINSADNKLYFRTGTGTAFNDLATAAAYADTNWHHVVCTFDGTTKRIYVDGAHSNSVGWANTIGWTGTIYHRIACQNDSGTNINIFTGLMDEVFLWNGSALSADQIKELYEGRYLGELRPNQFGTTAALYHLSSTTDAGGGNFHLTNNGTVTFPAGKFSNCADLGTSNSSKSLTIASALGITTGAMSMSGWFKVRTEIGSGAYDLFHHSYSTGGGNDDLDNRLLYDYNGGTRILTFKRYTNASADANYTITLGTTNWYHLAYVFTGSAVNGYVNGNLVTTVAAAGVTYTNNTGNGFRIGMYQGGFNYASVLVDEVHVASTALTANQIRTMYALGKGMYQ